jgi:L-rhamnose isomerase
MAVFEKRARTVTTHEYVMPNPVNWVEYNKAMNYALQECESVKRKPASDDAIWVTHEDDEIIIYWEE